MALTNDTTTNRRTNRGSRNRSKRSSNLQDEETAQLALEQDQLIFITILDSAQNKFRISIEADATVLNLKIEGEKVHSISPPQQRLISMGQLLQDAKLIKDYNITNGSIVHLFPKPNVFVTDSSPSAAAAAAASPSNNNSYNDNDGNAHPDANSNSNQRINFTALNSNSPTSHGNGNGSAHVPQIVLDTEEVNRQSSILILSTHEAYEALHRIRLLSFLLLVYSSIQLLRDVSIWLGPRDDTADGNIIIPPGDPTDTSIPGQSQYEDQLPTWQNRDYIEMGICALGIYVAGLGIKSTSEHIGQLTRRFVILLGVLGVSWNSYMYYYYVQELGSRESQEDMDDGKVYSDAMFAISLPFFLWAIFYLRAIQFYQIVREAEHDAEERSRTLASAIVIPGDSAVANDGNGHGNGNGNNQNDNDEHDHEPGTSDNDQTRRDGYDLELQVSERSIS